MPEVFAIAGSSFGAAPACPAGWAVTPNGNCGAPIVGCPSNMTFGTKACRSQAAINLQNAIKALAGAVGDGSVADLSIDGFIGPKTVMATNLVLSKYATQANARFRTGALSMAQIANEAPLIASILTAAASARGTKVPAAPVMRPPAPAEAVAKMGPAVMAPGGVTASGMPRALWGLVGLNAVLAGAGLWMTFRLGARSSYRARRPAYATA